MGSSGRAGIWFNTSSVTIGFGNLLVDVIERYVGITIVCRCSRSRHAFVRVGTSRSLIAGGFMTSRFQPSSAISMLFYNVVQCHIRISFMA